MSEPDAIHFESKIEEVLKKARRKLQDDLIEGERWDYHAHLGTHFLSQYSLCLKWLDCQDTDVEDSVITQVLFQTQLNDGSWPQLADQNLKVGELNATIFNYWFLKSTGESIDGHVLRKAREFIITHGGLEASSLFTQTFLALFNQHSWANLIRIPYVLFVEGLPSNYKSFSQWLIPHLMPMAYLRAKKVAKDLGENFNLGELWLKKPDQCKIGTVKANRLSDLKLIRKILERQQPKGSWGGYTVSTLLTMMSLEHFGQSDFIDQNKLKVAFLKGLQFIDQLYVHSKEASYQGCLMDGHYWDTILCANAFIDSGGGLDEMIPANNYIQKSQQAHGGFPYGYDFEYAPDVDDTAQAILLLSHWGKKNAVIESAANWLVQMQNSDGGWGAFDRDNIGNPILKIVAKPYLGSADLFDDSSADSTGHVLEALSHCGLLNSNSQVGQNAIRYLKKTQDPICGGWTGRWAVNFLFGTTCALVGLIKAGESVGATYIQKAIEFLLRSQNADGGFGESTSSYLNTSLQAQGVSTPTQTAWVLYALCVCGMANSPYARKAADYLVSSYHDSRGWMDASVTGTGHPGVLYMNYPSYAKAFPMTALGTFLKSIKINQGL